MGEGTGDQIQIVLNFDPTPGWFTGVKYMSDLAEKLQFQPISPSYFAVIDLKTPLINFFAQNGITSNRFR